MIKKIEIMLISLFMMLALATNPVRAENDGKITVVNPVKGETYTIYKLFDLYDFKDDAFLYTLDEASSWYAFFSGGSGKDYVTIVDQYIGEEILHSITLKNNVDVAAFAKACRDYAKTNSLANDGSDKIELENDDRSSIVFDELELGYYLLDSTLGALCSLDTTRKEITIREKNTGPIITKKVLHNGVEDDYNTASIGDELTFVTGIQAQPGAENYELIDEAGTGLTLLENPLVSVTANGENLAAANYTFTRNSDQKFTLDFKQTYLDTINETTYIIITYKAILNENAIIDGNGNINETYLKYGDGSSTAHVSTKTYTYQFQLVKTKADGTILDGAVFEIRKNGNLIKFVDEGNGVYRVAKASETNTTTSISAGYVTLKGLDNGTYFLSEKQPPAGYNAIDNAPSVTINGQNNNATITNSKYVSGGIQIINNTGGLLPMTGGSGSTMLMLVGTALVLGSLIVLIAKRRADEEK